MLFVGGMFDPDDVGDLTRDVARRLELTRRAVAIEEPMDQQEFGAEAGLSQPQYNQFEKGKRRLTLDAALALCNRYNLTLDWLYRGDPSGLPYRLATTIKSLRRPTSHRP